MAVGKQGGLAAPREDLRRDGSPLAVQGWSSLPSHLAQPSSTVTDPDAYAVYNAVIPSDWLIKSAHATELLIEDTSVVDSQFFKQCLPSGPGLTPPWQEALTDFNEQTATPKLLITQFSLPIAYR